MSSASRIAEKLITLIRVVSLHTSLNGYPCTHPFAYWVSLLHPFSCQPDWLSSDLFREFLSFFSPSSPSPWRQTHSQWVQVSQHKNVPQARARMWSACALRRTYFREPFIFIIIEKEHTSCVRTWMNTMASFEEGSDLRPSAVWPKCLMGAAGEGVQVCVFTGRRARPPHARPAFSILHHYHTPLVLCFLWYSCWSDLVEPLCLPFFTHC